MQTGAKTEPFNLARLWVLVLSLFASAQMSYGAYRVFRLKVVSYNERNRPSTQASVLTTLDPNQYQSYHSGFGRTVVSLIDTWYCPGDTSYKTFCKKPKERKLQRGLAGEFAPKRDKLPSNLQPIIP